MNGNDALGMGVILNKRYKVIRSLGSGGFSVTYLVFDRELEVNAAVKECFPFQLAARAEDGRGVEVPEKKQDEFAHLKSHFQKEAGFIYGMYDQPGICAVKDFFTENNTVYIVEEFLPGGSLKEYLRKQPGNRIPAKDCLEMFQPVMSGLAMLHGKGAVHGDISPDNLMFDGQGCLKLVDYGSVYIQEDSGNTNRTFKPSYAAPEQYLEEKHAVIGPWTDLYALCSVLYESLTGKRPPTVQERLKNKRIKPIRDLADASPAFEQGIMQGMELEISRRFFYMGTLQERLGCLTPEVRERLPETREIWSGKWMQAATEGLQLHAGRKQFFTARQKKQFLKAETAVIGVFLAAVLISLVWMKTHPAWTLDQELLRLRAEALKQDQDIPSEQITAEQMDEETLAGLEPYLSSKGSDGSRYYYNIPNEWFLAHPQYKGRGSALWTETAYLVPDLPFMEKVLSFYAGRSVAASGTGMSGSCVISGDGIVHFINTGENSYILPDGGEITLRYDAETGRISEITARGSEEALGSFLRIVFPYCVPETFLTEEEIAGLFSEADAVREQKDGTVYFVNVILAHRCCRLTLNRQTEFEDQTEAGSENREYRIRLTAR